MGTILENTPIWADIRKIVASDRKPVRFNYSATLHTTERDFEVIKLNTMTFSRDYGNKLADVTHVELKIALGDYVYLLYPHRDNFEVTIKETQLEETGERVEQESTIIETRYKGILVPDRNPIITATDISKFSREMLNTENIIDIHLELLDRSMEPLRIKTVRGVYRQATPKKIINSLLLGESQKVLVDGNPSVDGIDIVDPDNEVMNSQVVIPDGTQITSIPTLLQERAGGVYKSGIGTYLQYYKDSKLWFVYPLFDTELFDENRETDRLVIYSVPSSKLRTFDRTYMEDGKLLSIMITGDKNYIDNADVDTINQGIGFRVADARTMMKKPVEITDNGPVGKRTNVNNEMIFRDRPDGLNYAPVVKSGPTSNPYTHYTAIKAREGARMNVLWENANPRLLRPGMPCKYVFMDGEDVKSVKGIVLNVEAVVKLQGTAMGSNLHLTQCWISIFTDKIRDIPEVEDYNTPGTF